MNSIKLITDSASDIPKETAQRYQIEILNFPITIGDKSYESNKDFTNQEFYQILLTEPRIPTHAQITTIQFEEKFEEVFNQGYENCIYVSINRLGSSTYDNAIMAKNQFYEKYPERKDQFHIYVIDSRIYTIAYGYPVIQAAKKIQKGISVHEVVSYLTDWFESVEVYFAPYSLEFVKKSGRVSCAAAFMGELLGLKPIIRFKNGEVSIIEKVRGEKAIIPTLLKYAENNMIPKTPFMVVKGCLDEAAEKLNKEAEKRFRYRSEGIFEAGAAITINAGPKMVAIVIKSKNKS